MTKVLFISKKNDPDCLKAAEFLAMHFPRVAVHYGEGWGGKPPPELWDWEGDYIVSYLGRWILPPGILARARRAAINFHPASPEFPGLGAVNFALYEGAATFGVTCHHMEPVVDTGRIIAVKRFPVFPADTVASLLSRTYARQLSLFYDVVEQIAAGGSLPDAKETWMRRPYTRKEFDCLFTITPEMDNEEVARRIRALDYREWGPYIELHGHRFKYERRKRPGELAGT